MGSRRRGEQHLSGPARPAAFGHGIAVAAASCGGDARSSTLLIGEAQTNAALFRGQLPGPHTSVANSRIDTRIPSGRWWLRVPCLATVRRSRDGSRDFLVGWDAHENAKSGYAERGRRAHAASCTWAASPPTATPSVRHCPI